MSAELVRMLGKIAVTPDCWLWTASKDRHGYGRIKTGGQVCLAHRVMWERATGERLDAQSCILHTCDNPACVRPTHLWRGSHQDNMADKVRKGRQSRLGRSRKQESK
jgi:hypothetical protein